MRCSYLKDFRGIYFRVLVSIFIVLGYLGWDNNLVDIYGVIILY